MFAVFSILNIFGELVQQQMPHFVTQRALYEVHERPYAGKSYCFRRSLSKYPGTRSSLWTCLSASTSPSAWAKMPRLRVRRQSAAASCGFYSGSFSSVLAPVCTHASRSRTRPGGRQLGQCFVHDVPLGAGRASSPERCLVSGYSLYRGSPLLAGYQRRFQRVSQYGGYCSSSKLVHLNPERPDMSRPSLLHRPERRVFENGNATTGCEYCPIADTNVFSMGTSSNFDNRWRDFGKCRLSSVTLRHRWSSTGACAQRENKGIGDGYATADRGLPGRTACWS